MPDPAAVPLTQRLDAAFTMARTEHNGDAIKGTDRPYLLHLMDVASLVLRLGGDEDLAIAGLLHDVVEDAGGAPMLAEIRSAFGDRVADVVLACSDSLEVDREAKPPWWERKLAYLDHLRVAGPDVVLVSGADKISNLRSIVADHARVGDALWRRFRTGRPGTLWYYSSIVDILEAVPAPHSWVVHPAVPLRAEFDQLVDALGASVVEADVAEARREAARHGA